MSSIGYWSASHIATMKQFHGGCLCIPPSLDSMVTDPRKNRLNSLTGYQETNQGMNRPSMHFASPVSKRCGRDRNGNHSLLHWNLKWQTFTSWNHRRAHRIIGEMSRPLLWLAANTVQASQSWVSPRRNGTGTFVIRSTCMCPTWCH